MCGISCPSVALAVPPPHPQTMISVALSSEPWMTVGKDETRVATKPACSSLWSPVEPSSLWVWKREFLPFPALRLPWRPHCLSLISREAGARGSPPLLHPSPPTPMPPCTLSAPPESQPHRPVRPRPPPPPGPASGMEVGGCRCGHCGVSLPSPCLGAGGRPGALITLTCPAGGTVATLTPTRAGPKGL